MTFLWNFNMFFCVACIIMFGINIAKAEYLMKERHPELHFRETPFLTVISTAIKIIVVSICPIVNIAMFLTLVFRDNELIESAVRQAYDNYHKNDHSEAE